MKQKIYIENYNDFEIDDIYFNTLEGELWKTRA